MPLTKAFISLVLTLFLLSEGLAQSTWLRSAGGISNDEALAIAPVGNDAFVITGYFFQGAEFWNQNLSSNGGGDAFVSKLSSSGTEVWSVGLGGAGSDRGLAIDGNEAGLAVVAGTFHGSANFGEIELVAEGDSTDIFVAVLDASGEVLWAKRAGGTGNDAPNGVCFDEMGNVLIGGYFRGNASFGTLSVTSQNYPDSDVPSNDGFIAKLDANGNWLWAKSLGSDEDNRVTDLDTDSSGNVYAVGTFSDTLTYDNTYENQVFNAGLVLKTDSEGNEVWLRSMTATSVLPYSVEVANEGSIAVGGDYQGQLLVIDSNNEVFPYEPGNHIFAMKWDESGELVWLSEYASDNQVTAKGLSTGPDSEVYLSGTFSCSFTDMADLMGEGAFYSMGFEDVFALRFDATGDPAWQRHYASPGRSWCSSVLSTSSDEVIIAGGFQKYFHVPAGIESTEYPENSALEFLFSPNQTTQYCGNNTYDDWLSVKRAGNALGERQIFISSCYHPSTPLLDYRIRFGNGCDLLLNEPCLTIQEEQPVCPDSLQICEQEILVHYFEIGQPGIYGPDLEIEWFGPYTAIGDHIYTNGTGMYGFQSERLDGCRSFSDSLYVEMLPIPPFPLISDELEVNIEELYTIDLDICADEVLIWSDTCETCTISWSQGLIQDDGLLAVQSGNYAVTATNASGCTRSNNIHIDLSDTLALFAAPENFYAYFQNVNITGDTVFICPNDDIFLSLEEIPAEYAQNSDYTPFADYWISLNGEPLDEGTWQDWQVDYEPPEAGHYEIVIDAYDQWTNVCGEESLFVEIYTLEFWVEFLTPAEPDFQVFPTTVELCPGDTALVQMSGADVISYPSGQVLEVLNDTSFVVNNEASFNIVAQFISPDGCVASQSVYFNADIAPIPEAITFPEDGIVCPNDSVLLVCEPGQNFSWVGPFGNEISTNDSAWVTTPGIYYCVHESFTGCIQESNVVEVFEYNTPLLVAEPGTFVCVEDEVTLEVLSNYQEDIEWQSPLSGSDPTQVIIEAGIYSVNVSGCGVVSELSIEVVWSDLFAEIITTDSILCPLDSTILSANSNAIDLVWLPGNIDADSIWVNEPGEYTLMAIDEQGCEILETIIIEGDALDAPSTQDVVLCLGDDALLQAFSEDDVYWSLDQSGDPVIAEGNELLIEEVIEDDLLYVFSASAECNSEVIGVHVIVSSGSFVPPIFADDSVCIGGTATLSTDVVSEVEYSWELPSGAYSYEAVLTIDYFEEDDAGWYVLMASDSICTSEPDSVFLEFFSYPTQPLSVNDSLHCEGETLVISSGAEGETYQWQTPQGMVEGDPLIISPLESDDSGTYTLSLEGSTCLLNFQPIEIYVGTYPQFVLDDASLGCIGGSLVAEIPEDFDSYLWSTGDVEPTTIVTEEGWLSVTAENFPGCARTEEIYVDDVECEDTFFNIFSPNGDGVNELIDFSKHPGNFEVIRIYNRWGHIIRHLETSLTWNGTDDNGNLVSEGTYYWIGTAGERKGQGSIMVVY